MLYEKQVISLENERNILISENNDLKIEIEFLKKEIKNKLSNKHNAYFGKEYIGSIPMDINSVIQEKGLERN